MNYMKGESREIPTIEALEDEAKASISSLRPLGERATLVTLSGELGAGKTSFVQAVARTLGVVEPATSPTFVIQKTYQLPEDAAFKRLVHIDAYRLKALSDLDAAGLPDAMKDPQNLIMLEWPERVPGIEMERTLAITLEALPDGSRRITYA
jgi:tRNA threonylcarbamoyladenosine biosynthesis protein TsaE